MKRAMMPDFYSVITGLLIHSNFHLTIALRAGLHKCFMGVETGLNQ